MTLTATEPLLLAELFHLAEVPTEAPRPRYNIAPTQDVMIVTGETPRRISPVRWGLVPSWAKDLKIGSNLINTRADTIATKPAFRTADWRRRHVVV